MLNFARYSSHPGNSVTRKRRQGTAPQMFREVRQCSGMTGLLVLEARLKQDRRARRSAFRGLRPTTGNTLERAVYVHGTNS
jgi:hypothetical protein